MRTGLPSCITRSVFVVMGALTVSGGTIAAQEADFLFETPRVTFGIFGGYALPSASSDIFDMTRDSLTVEGSDFYAGVFGAQLGIRLTDRLELALRGEYTRSDTRSEYRNWVDFDELPIEQTTEFRRAPVTASLKYYFEDRGRSIGRFAWIPNRWTPYVGVGGGWTFYRFEQEGDWIDFTDPDLPIRPDTFVSDGAAPTAHVLAGAELSMGPRWFLTGEGRYSWASSEMDPSFASFDDIDLSGFHFTVGISARF